MKCLAKKLNYIIICCCIFFLSCNKIKSINELGTVVFNAVINKDIDSFKNSLLTYEEFLLYPKNIFSNDYERYIKINLEIFKRGIKKLPTKVLYLSRVKSNNSINNNGLITGTKMFFYDDTGNEFHMRILHAIKVNNQYKVYLLDDF